MCALCLVDAAEGSGGAFFGNYQQVLPRIADLQVPFCLRPSVVDQLQNETVETGARGQKERLTMLFPQLMPDEVRAIPPTAAPSPTTPPPAAQAVWFVQPRPRAWGDGS